MKIPKKITPDNLKDTIVELKYNSNKPYELLLGLSYNLLKKDYKYTPFSPMQQQFNSLLVPFNISNINGFFDNGLIKIQILNNSIIFNCLDKYIGWEEYFPVIKKVINSLFSEELFTSFNRIGVRYISKFDNESIFKNIKCNVHLEVPNDDLHDTSLRTEFIEDALRIIINLSNNISKTPNPDIVKFYSLFDIDVINDFISLTDLNELFLKINIAHNKQKFIFFSLLSDDYLRSLNPIY